MIKEFYLSIVDSLPPEMQVAVLAMLPVTELRFALPFGVFHLGLWTRQAAFWAILGNIIPMPIIFFLFEFIRDFFERRVPKVHSFFLWLERRSYKKLEKSYEVYGFWALMAFTALPLPMTGMYTATVASIVFKIPFKRAFLAIFMGLIISGLIVSLLSLSARAFVI